MENNLVVGMVLYLKKLNSFYRAVYDSTLFNIAVRLDREKAHFVFTNGDIWKNYIYNANVNWLYLHHKHFKM